MAIGLVGGLFDAIIDFVGDFFLSLFDLIPKSIYLLAAVFLSVIDVLQCLVRKLAGLDIYWVQYPGNMFDQSDPIARVQVDPLTEFIYGILGYGDTQTVEVYKGLNTVFLSLAVFAVICLVVTSMIAIIKSHYNEDVAGTNPWKYIYTAIKAVLTFAIIPFVTVIGLKLSSWALQTLDGIIASSATEESMKSMFGDNTENFKAGYIGSWNEDPPEGATEEQMGQKYYARYDMFGLGVYTSSTPFSGMLFKACAYDANRARKGYADGGPWKFEFWSEVGKPDPGCGIVFFDSEFKFFGKGNGLSGSDEERGTAEQAELVAQQVDYAFMNNLNVKGYVWYGGIRRMNVSTYFVAHDLIMPIVIGMSTFSKFHVGLVWEFYNLWQFNYIVAFAGGTTMVGIMLSVIIGLMSRLLKSAILFLVYPALLGIAPLDNFKAFKSWVNQFIQQIMMAFGSIIGMNLTLLILPYANNFAFFNLGLVDALVNCIIVIAGLMMMKDIIAMISNFAGGADANAAGSALKGEVGKAFAGGAKIAGKVGLKAGKAVGKGVLGIAKKTGLDKKLLNHRFGDKSRAVAKRETANADLAKQEGKLLAKLDPEALGRKEAAMNATNRNKWADDYQQYGFKSKAEAKAFYDLAHGQEARGSKKAVEGANALFDKANEQEQILDELDTIDAEKKKNNEFIEKNKNKTGHSIAEGIEWGRDKVNAINNWAGGGGRMRDGYMQETDAEGKVHYYKADKDGNKVIGEDGKAIEVEKKQAMYANSVFGAAERLFDKTGLSEAGKELADGFLKGISDIGSSLGLDKMLKGMSDIFEGGTTFKGGVYDKSDKKEGDALLKDQHKEAEKNAEKRAEDLEAKIEKLGSIIKEDLPGSIKVAFTEALKGASFTAGGTGTGNNNNNNNP